MSSGLGVIAYVQSVLILDDENHVPRCLQVIHLSWYRCTLNMNTSLRTLNTYVMRNDQAVWITGASSGIGEQLASKFAREGANLILSARNTENLQKVKDRLSSGPGKVFLLPMDLEKLDEIPEKAEVAFARFGKVDILVHNAAVALRDYALDTLMKTDQKLMAINYFGPVCLTKQVLPHMLERESGQIVVISSLTGKFGVPRTSSYAASKHALHGFFESLRSEIAGRGVKITMVVPGIIQTRITAHALTGSGTFHDRVEETFRKAYSPEKAAEKILKAIRRRKEEVYVGGLEWITLAINRISPWLLRRFIRNHPIRFVRNLKQKLTLHLKLSG